jgi:hypothetical protein
MKDKHISTIWLIYTVVMALIGSQIEGEEPLPEKIFFSALIAQFLLVIWILLSFAINFLILYSNIRFKIPAPKRFKDKITPIYEMATYHEAVYHFTIKKYVLKWEEFNYETNLFYIVPFVSLLLKYKYVEVGEYEFEYEISGITDIALLYEDRYNEIHAKELEIKTEKDIKTNRINKLNKTFLENYEN